MASILLQCPFKHKSVNKRMLWEGLLCKGKFLAIVVLVYTLFVAVCCDSGTRSIEFEDGESDAH